MMGTGNSSLRNGGSGWRTMPNPIGIAPGATATPAPALSGAWGAAAAAAPSPLANASPSQDYSAGLARYNAWANGQPMPNSAPQAPPGVSYGGDAMAPMVPNKGPGPVSAKPMPIGSLDQAPAGPAMAPDVMSHQRQRLTQALARGTGPQDYGYGPSARLR